MASLRGISVVEQSDEQIRALLYKMEGVSAPSVETTPTDAKHDYKLDISQAQLMHKDSSNSLVTLLGNVKASFLLSNESEQKELSSNKMLVDVDGTQLSAMGNVSYVDKGENAAVQKMEGDVITLDWNKSRLTVSNGMTQTERKNSDDEAVNFFTTGDEISYHTDEGGIFFKNGFITNNPVQAYSSITAKKLAMMDNGDMVIENAYLSIGRLPVLWVPVLLFPGSKMLGNPAIGYESERGMFVNTTFVLYGTDTDIANGSSSSFTRLLESGDSSEKILDGSIYRKLKSGEKLSPIEQWAKDSGSFLSLRADSYQNNGIAVGVSSLTNLWSKKFAFKGNGIYAVDPNGSKTKSSYSSYGKTRYMVDAALTLDTDVLDLKVAFPLYSDPKVMRSYANRFTSFSLDHLFGATWPTDYSSDITSYTWSATGSLSMPKEWKSDLLNTLTISTASASAVYSWVKPSGEKEYSYQLSSVTIPSLTASASGTLLSLDSSKKKEKEKAKDENATKEKAPEEKGKEEQAKTETTDVKSDTTTETKTDTSSGETKDGATEGATSETPVAASDTTLATAAVQEESKNVEGGVDAESVPSDSSSSDEGVPVEQPPLDADGKPVEPTIDPIVNEMLKKIYAAKEQTSSSTTATHSLGITYSATENLSQTAKSVSNVLNWDATHYFSSITTGNLKIAAVPDSRFFTVYQTFTPKYSYVEDKSKSAWLSKTFLFSSETVASIPILGLTYTIAEKLYSYSETTTTDSATQLDSTEIEQKYFAFTSDYVTTHQLVLSKSFPTLLGTLTPSLTYILPPLTESLLPALTWKVGKWSFSGSFKFLQENGILSRNLITTTIGYSSDLLTFSMKDTYQCASYKADDLWYPFTSVGSLALKKFGMTLSASYDYTNMSTNGSHYFNSIAGSFSFSPLKSTITYKGTAENLELSTWVTNLSFSAWKLQWWKKRCSLTMNMNSSLSINFINPYATSLSVTAGFTFSIAEFMDLTFSVTSGNSSFFMYEDSSGNFSWNLMFQDLLRSFDFFGGGNRRTNFNMSKISLEFIHYMDDWTLNCKCSGSVVLSNNTYSWVPVVSVFMQWKTIPELKVDEAWTRSAGSTAWTKTSTT